MNRLEKVQIFSFFHKQAQTWPMYPLPPSHLSASYLVRVPCTGLERQILSRT